jgi:hypothetical protein
VQNSDILHAAQLKCAFTVASEEQQGVQNSPSFGQVLRRHDPAAATNSRRGSATGEQRLMLRTQSIVKEQAAGILGFSVEAA